MTLILDKSRYMEVNTYTWDKGKVYLSEMKPDGNRCMEISMQDFCEMALYVLTNTDLAKDDPRIRFVDTIKELRKAKGYNGPKSSRFVEKEAK